MRDDLINDTRFRRLVPPVAALVFTALFGWLGSWQLDRAAEKRALLGAFDKSGDYSRPGNFENLRPFERIELAGRYVPDRQVLIDNIVKEGRLGYYVITPFRTSANAPLLLVNRGWLQKSAPGAPISRGTDLAGRLTTGTGVTTIRGMVGHLPQVGVRPGNAFDGAGDWPKTAVYPTYEEVAAELDADLVPIVLLLSPESASGFLRQWRPNVSGPMTHYSYAFQWFAMAAAVIALFAWHWRKGAPRDGSE